MAERHDAGPTNYPTGLGQSTRLLAVRCQRIARGLTPLSENHFDSARDRADGIIGGCVLDRMFAHTMGLSMADEWYYWHDSEVLGPFSGRLLVGLAAVGEVLPTDIVWKNGVERGVPASTVRHLFRPESVDPAPLVVAAVAAPSSDVANDREGPAAGPESVVSSAEAGEKAQPWYCGPATIGSTRKARAVAGKGAIIVGQDGSTVKFRKKCTECGYEDSSWRAVPIARGTTRVTFYCPKCRRSRPVEIHGHVN